MPDLNTNSDTSVDVLNPSEGGGFSGIGSVASALIRSDFNVNSLRNNAVLRQDEWEFMDRALVDVMRPRLEAASLLIGSGLAQEIEGLGTTKFEWETSSDMTGADVSMSGVTDGEEDRITFAAHSMPLPIIHKDFRINIRALAASRKIGQSLDVMQLEVAGIKVAQTIENIIFNGYSSSGIQINGLKDAPDRNTVSGASNWEAAGTNGDTIVSDTISMISSLQAKYFYGPYGLFITYAAYTNLLKDLKSNSDKSILMRLREIPNLVFIQPTHYLNAKDQCMINLSPDVIKMIVGMQPRIVQWDTRGGMTAHFKVMAIIVPRIASTIADQSGVVYNAIA